MCFPKQNQKHIFLGGSNLSVMCTSTKSIDDVSVNNIIVNSENIVKALGLQLKFYCQIFKNKRKRYINVHEL